MKDVSITNIFFESAKTSVDNFIQSEFPNFSNKLTAQLINFCSVISSYEEEGTKLRPSILFTNNMDKLVKNIKNSSKLVVFPNETENAFRNRMKSLATFSMHDWNIYVQLNNDGTIEMGLYKSFNSMKENNFEKSLFINQDISKSNSIHAFIVQSVSNTYIKFMGTKGNTLNIDFSLESKKVMNFEEDISDFIDASFSKLKTTSKKLSQIKTLYRNIFQNVYKKIHGCICVVVDSDYKDTGLFADGIWLKEPIEFSKLLMQSKNFSEAKLSSYSELFMDMLNYDGITIVDNKGRIRAYNVFVESDTSKDFNILGGARKRAAFTVINSKVKKIIGVYFQSQEGEVFYNRNRNFKERIRKIKVSDLSNNSATLTANADKVASENIVPPLLQLVDKQDYSANFENQTIEKNNKLDNDDNSLLNSLGEIDINLSSETIPLIDLV